MFDWQNIIVALIVLLAAAYVLRRALTRLRSFLYAKSNSASCATGCGSCGNNEKPAMKPATTLFQITRSNTAQSRRAR